MTNEELVDISAVAKLATLRARTGVLEKLTCLSAPAIKRIFRAVTGESPKSGQLPYTTHWYEMRRERLIHCSLFLRIFRAEAIHPEKPRAVAFLGSYAVYEHIVELLPESWKGHKLDVNYAFLATQLFALGDLVLRYCEKCHAKYISASTALPRQICSGCQLLMRQRGAGGLRTH